MTEPTREDSPVPNERWLSATEVAQVLSVSTSTIRSAIRSGALRAHRLRNSRLIRIALSDVQSLLEPLAVVRPPGRGAS
jgi:excisionase family DNA binding protein